MQVSILIGLLRAAMGKRELTEKHVKRWVRSYCSPLPCWVSLKRCFEDLLVRHHRHGSWTYRLVRSVECN